MKFNIVIILLLLAAFLSGKQWRSERDNIEMMKRWELIDYLALKEKQGDQYFLKLKSFESEMEKITKKRKSLHLSLKELLDNGKVKGSKVDAIAEELMDLELIRVELKKKHLQETAKILSPEQQAKYLLFEKRFKHKLKEHLKERRLLPFPSRHDRWH